MTNVIDSIPAGKPGVTCPVCNVRHAHDKKIIGLMNKRLGKIHDNYKADEGKAIAEAIKGLTSDEIRRIAYEELKREFGD